ncbi:MAG TPA: universal stress protein [Streptosporangiaceae bacterium]
MVGTDGSEASLRAVEWAAREAAAWHRDPVRLRGADPAAQVAGGPAGPGRRACLCRG